MADRQMVRIAIVGPCSSGKSTLRAKLNAAGYTNIRNPAQEHSYVPDMWRKITRPDFLIYLDVDYATTLERRPHIDLGVGRVQGQKLKLAHAHRYADLVVDTNGKTQDEIAQLVLSYLSRFDN